MAGRSFLDAFLAHGTWNDLAVLVRRRGLADSLERFCGEHSSSQLRARRLRIFEERNFHNDFGNEPPARQLYFPFPIEARYAWAHAAFGGGIIHAVGSNAHALLGGRGEIAL